MTRRITVFLGAIAVAVLASSMARVAVLAQGPAEAQGAPAATKEPGKTAPIKVTQRVYDKKVLLASHPALTESEQTGRAIYQRRCAYCHDGVGQPSYKTMGDWLGDETVQSLGVDAMKAFINSGTVRMPGFQYELDNKQMDDLIAFIRTIPSSDKPTQSQLEGKAAALDGSD